MRRQGAARGIEAAIRRCARAAIAAALIGAVAAPMARADAVLFMYHRFGEDEHPTTSVRLAQFDAHLDYLAENGFEVWPLAQVVEHLRQGRAFPERTAAITIDDAYLSVYREAFPRLKARGWPFTVFVATGPVDAGLRGFMSWAQMREMAAAGASFGNHGVSHDYLVRRREGEAEGQWRERMRGEILQAQARLREELGAENFWFAYPYGEYDEPLAALVRHQGYVGFGQQSGAVGRLSDLRSLPRFPMAEPYAGIEEFAQKANTLAMPVRSASPWNPLLGEERRPLLTITLEAAGRDFARTSCYVSGQGRVAVNWVERDRGFTVRAESPLPLGRSRYNCTAPGPNGRYYWYSHPWLVQSAR